MDKDSFLQELKTEVTSLDRVVSTENGDWVVKGFIDVAKNIYTLYL